LLRALQPGAGLFLSPGEFQRLSQFAKDCPQHQFEIVALDDSKSLLQRLLGFVELCACLAQGDALMQQRPSFASWRLQPPVNMKALVKATGPLGILFPSMEDQPEMYERFCQPMLISKILADFDRVAAALFRRLAITPLKLKISEVTVHGSQFFAQTMRRGDLTRALIAVARLLGFTPVIPRKPS